MSITTAIAGPEPGDALVSDIVGYARRRHS
jgi:hypothetical protein